MKSMTGHGRGEGAQDGHKVAVEVSSVNRRQGEVSVQLPRELEALEPRVRELVGRLVSRGRLQVRVTLQLTGEEAATAQINVPLARAYARELSKLARTLKLAGPVTLDHLVRAPGVFQTNDVAKNAERYWPALEEGLGRAMAALVRMREREGAHLAADLEQRMATMRKAVREVRKRAPAALKRHEEQLRQKLAEAGLGRAGPEDERLMKELVYFADRSDITEELTRLESHFKQFADCTASKEPVGRTLDFLAQEINREVNTIGSKAGDAEIARAVVTLKAELERFREQVQNVE
jgi:uncharacterized protein (TIGR00255 family)